MKRSSMVHNRCFLWSISNEKTICFIDPDLVSYRCLCEEYCFSFHFPSKRCCQATVTPQPNKIVQIGDTVSCSETIIVISPGIFRFCLSKTSHCRLEQTPVMGLVSVHASTEEQELAFIQPHQHSIETYRDTYPNCSCKDSWCLTSFGFSVLFYPLSGGCDVQPLE